jgi:AmiR/NasT family two-component response regulator
MTPPRANIVAVPHAPDDRLRELEERVRQLQSGLERRAVIECAKGILMERHDISAHDAFELLRRSARGSSRSVFELANLVINARTLLPVRPRPPGG